MNADFWQTSLAAALIAFLVNRIYEAMSESKKAVGLMRAMLLDIERMEKDAKTFIEKRAAAISENPLAYFAPAQRMPISFVNTGLETLAPGKWMTLDELRSLHELRAWADEANRCLDRLLELVAAHDGTEQAQQLLSSEGSRVSVKCGHIRDAGPKTRAAIQAAISRHDFFGDT